MGLVLAFAELAGAVLFLTAAITGATFAEVLSGQALLEYRREETQTQTAAAASASSSSSAGSGLGAIGSAVAKAIGGFPASVDPVPGAKGSRLDQGADGTASTFLSPWDGKVVYSSASDPGWGGGGYVAIESTADPTKVFYEAEGLRPIVKLGEMVTAGQQVGVPIASPYNGIVGNYEIGLANPSAPSQPLAQVISDPSAMVDAMYHWLLSLGGPQATSTSDAGHA